MDSQPVFCKSITAHFSKEDLSFQGDGTFLRVGGSMVEIQGLSKRVKSGPLVDLMNTMKDETVGTDKLIVLIQTPKTNEVLLPILEANGLKNQEFYVSTNSKYVDIKVKKTTCKIELNSNSLDALLHDSYNIKFLQFLKIFLQGRCNLSSKKVAQALSWYFVDSLHFEIQKYSDSIKLLEEMQPWLPSSLAKLAITYSNDFCMPGDESKEAQADKLLSTCAKKFSKTQFLVESSRTTADKRIFNVPIMASCSLDENATKNLSL